MDHSPPGSSCMGFPRQEYLVGCHLLLQGIFPTQGLNLCLFMSPALAGRFFALAPLGKPPSPSQGGADQGECGLRFKSDSWKGFQSQNSAFMVGFQRKRSQGSLKKEKSDGGGR